MSKVLHAFTPVQNEVLRAHSGVRFNRLTITLFKVTSSSQNGRRCESRVFVEFYVVQLVVQDRPVLILLISIAEYTKSRILLGVDFISVTGTIQDVPKKVSHFADQPNEQQALIKENSSVIDSVLPGTSDLPRLDALLTEYSDIFALSSEAIPSAEHAIKLVDDVPIIVPPYRMSFNAQRISPKGT